MASATTLDEVMEVHEAYLSSIQRQCFVASDKLVSNLSFLLQSSKLNSKNFILAKIVHCGNCLCAVGPHSQSS